jgi:amidase
MNSLYTLDATALAMLLREGHVSARDVAEASLARIDALDRGLSAFVTVDATAARAQARALDEHRAAGGVCGPLHGLPVAIKDVTDTAGLRTTHGSALFADHVPRHDAESVARLRRAGAVIIGKTNTPEFAFGAACTNRLCGPTRNPWDRTRTSGGSSGGAAVAVATGMAALAQGTDFGGSVRMPASFCGVFGLRPEPGTIPEPGRLPAWSRLATQGVLTRSVRDAALMMAAMAGPHPLDPLSRSAPDLHGPAPDAPRIAVSVDLGGAFPVDDEVAQAFAAACDDIAEALGPLRHAAPDVAGAFDAFKTLRAAESWFRSGALVTDHADALSPSFVWNVQQGHTLTAQDYLQADALRSRIWRQATRFFNDHDVLVMPSCAVMPFASNQDEVTTVGGRCMPSIIDYLACTAIVSLLAFPAMSVPAPRSPGELPFGVQLVVAPGQEALLMKVASQLEAAGFRHRFAP